MHRQATVFAVAIAAAIAVNPPLPSQTLPHFNRVHAIEPYPETTDPPRFYPRRWGGIQNRELFARQDDDLDSTCMYVSGNPSSPVVCGESSACYSITSTPVNDIFCCGYDTYGSFTSCLYTAACVPWSDGGPASGTVGIISSDGAGGLNSLYCPNQNAYCITTRLIQEGGVEFDYYACTDTSGILVTGSETTTEGPVTDTETSVVFQTITAAANTTTTMPLSSPTPSSLSSPSVPSVVSNPVAAPAGTTSAAPAPGPKSHTGAIVGGVVGGIGGLALIGAAVVIFLAWRKKSQRVEPMREVSQYGGSSY